MLAAGSISTVSLGQSSFNIRPGNLDTSTGTWVSPIDNPIAYAVLPLTELESVELRDDGWDDYGFYLEGVQTCSPSDTQCVPVAGVGDTEVHSVWPTALGNWVGPMSIMVEQPNAALGTMRTTFEFTKYDYYRNEIPLATGSAALASDVIVVPVNVVVAVPAESIDPIGHDVANSVAEPALFRALFDNQWEVDTTRSSDPGGLNRAFYGGYLTRTTLHPSSTASLIRRVTRLTYDNINPDDVFAQCGIQFRLASVLVYEVSNEEDIFFVGKCSSANNGESALSEVHNRMVGDARREPTLAYGTFAENGIEILFSPRIEDCEDVVGLASPGYQIAAIRLIPKNISAPELTLSHEIGHLLGLDDMATLPNLMNSGSGGEQTSHIGRCDYRDGELLPNVPYGCEPNPGDQYEHCTALRQGATGIANGASANYSPIAMDPPESSLPTWTLDGHAVGFDMTEFTEGTAALIVSGGGYRVIESPYFSAAELSQVGTILELAVSLAEPQPNPYWLGSIDAFISASSVDVTNAYLGHVELTGLELGRWNTVSLVLDEATQSLLSGEAGDLQIALAVNTPTNAPNVLLDGLRFGGDLVDIVRDPSDTGDASIERLFSFEDSNDWSVSNGTGSASDWVTDGTSSLKVAGSGYVEIESRTFNTTDLAEVMETVSVDLAVPTTIPNPYWLGALQLFISCPSANVYNAFQGQIDLADASLGEFNQLIFDLDESAVSAFATMGNVCSLKFALNVAAGSGDYIFDHVAFIP